MLFAGPPTPPAQRPVFAVRARPLPSTALGPATGPFREHALALHPASQPAAARLNQRHRLFPWSFLFIYHRPTSTLIRASRLPPVPTPKTTKTTTTNRLAPSVHIHPRPIETLQTAGLHCIVISTLSALSPCPVLKDWVTAPVIGVNTSQHLPNAHWTSTGTSLSLVGSLQQRRMTDARRLVDSAPSSLFVC